MKSISSSFGDVQVCVLGSDGVAFTNGPHQICAFLPEQNILLPPGKHRLMIGLSGRNKAVTWGNNASLDADLKPGVAYAVAMQPDMAGVARLWLADASGQAASPTAKLDVSEHVMGRDNAPASFSGIGHATERRRLLVLADFGTQAQPFEDAFVKTFRSQATSCQEETDILAVPHAVGLVLEPPRPPTPAEVVERAATFQADGILRIIRTSWSSRWGAPPADKPFQIGTFLFFVSLAPTPQARPEWSIQISQDLFDSAGAEFAKTLVLKLALEGTFRHCPPLPTKN